MYTYTGSAADFISNEVDVLMMAFHIIAFSAQVLYKIQYLRKVQLAELWFNLLETPILLAGSLITVKPTVVEKVTCQR